MSDLVAYLLAHRQYIPNRALIACLALAQMAPDPAERIHWRRLAEVLCVNRRNHLGQLLPELRRLGLLEYEVSREGYLLKRIGPRSPPTPSAPSNPTTEPNP
jgi:hypothetical protein